MDLAVVAITASWGLVVVGNLLAWAVDLGSHPSSIVVVAYHIEEVVDPSSYRAVVASFLVIDIHPSFEVAGILVVRIAMVASVDRNQVATSYLVVGSPFVVGHILVAATSFVVSPSFQVVNRTWVIVAEDSRVVAFLPSLVVIASSAEEACRP